MKRAIVMLALSLFGPTAMDAEAEALCYPAWVTGYVKSEFPGRTYDGTSVWSGEPIAASAWDLPINSIVWVEGVGTYRIADRGMLGRAGWIDVLVDTRAEAHAITGTRTICVTPP